MSVRTQQASAHMLAALRTIAERGGRAIPAGGGYWNDAAGARLTHPPLPGTTCAALGQPESIGTQTLQALSARGLMAYEPAVPGQPHWKRAMCLSAAGRALVGSAPLPPQS